MKMRKLSGLLILYFLISAYNFGRLTPPYPGTYDIGPPPKKNVARIPLNFNFAPEAPRYSPSEGPQRQKGVQPVLVILVRFSDVAPDVNHTRAYFQKLLFDKTSSQNLLYRYYYEVSYGALEVDDGDGLPDTLLGSGSPIGTNPTDWVTSAYTRSQVGGPSGGDVDNYNLMEDFVRDALSKAENQISNYNSFDKDGDGVIDHLIIIHSGGDQALSGDAYDVWSQHIQISPPATFGTKLANFAVIVSENDLGVICHEFGHDLGLVDIYNVNTGDAVAGHFSLMDIGVWNGSPASSSPAHLDPWSRAYLGYVVPYEVVDNMRAVNVPKVEAPYPVLDVPDVTKLVFKVDISDTEYFLVENRRKVGYDAYLPYEGLAIWHIYQGINFDTAHNDINTNASYPGVDMISAVTDAGEYGIEGADPIPFPGPDDIREIGPTTIPSTKSYDNDRVSNIYIRNISDVSDTMTVDIIVHPAFMTILWEGDTITAKLIADSPAEGIEFYKDGVLLATQADRMESKTNPYAYLYYFSIKDSYPIEGVYAIKVYLANDTLVDTITVSQLKKAGDTLTLSLSEEQKVSLQLLNTASESFYLKIYPADVSWSIFSHNSLYSDEFPPLKIDFPDTLDVQYQLRFYYNLASAANYAMSRLIVYKVEKGDLIPILDSENNSEEGYVQAILNSPGIYALGEYTVSASQDDFLTVFRGADAYTYPNPIEFVNGARVYFRYLLNAPGVISIKIFDITGRMIKNICEQKSRELGLHKGEEYWDGKDFYGDRVPPGVYIGVLSYVPEDYKNVTYFKYFKIVVK